MSGIFGVSVTSPPSLSIRARLYSSNSFCVAEARRLRVRADPGHEMRGLDWSRGSQRLCKRTSEGNHHGTVSRTCFWRNVGMTVQWDDRSDGG